MQVFRAECDIFIRPEDTFWWGGNPMDFFVHRPEVGVPGVAQLTRYHLTQGVFVVAETADYVLVGSNWHRVGEES